MLSALLSFCMLCVISLLFLFSSTLIDPQTYRHARGSLPYVLTAVGLYVFDHLARIARTRYTTGWLTAESALNGGTTLVHVRSLRAGWRAGQHVRVRVVSNSWFGWWTTWFFCRARPFTIATGSDSSCMMLPIKAMGSWTRNLLRMAGKRMMHAPNRCIPMSSVDGDRLVRFVLLSRVHTVSTRY